MENEITLSVISHGQSNLVDKLFHSLEDINFKGKVICTINNGVELFDKTYNLDLSFIFNPKPYGFGENHNNAFKICKTKYFCVVNPDVIFDTNIFNILVDNLENYNKIGVITSGSIDSYGVQQDNARDFPNIFTLFLKVFGRHNYIKYNKNQGLIEADWVSGQFMFFNSIVYKNLDGFSPKYFMYYEDVDICKRLRLNGYKVILNSNIYIIHNAQRSSHFNIKLFFIHLQSAFKYFFINDF
jgi:N-acetylglucosaminyl-diphospho-decaprenol L-rhamnosyltransferase